MLAFFWLSFIIRVAAGLWAIALWHRLRDGRMAVMVGVALLTIYVLLRLGRSSVELTAFSMTAMIAVNALLLATIYVIKRLIERERDTAEIARGRVTQLELLYEHVSDGIFVTTPERRYLDVNPRGLEMTGYTLDELRGMTVDDLLVPEDASEMRAQVASVAPGGTISSRRRIRRKDGSILFAEIDARRLPDARWVVVARDVSTRHAAEIALAGQERKLSQLVSSYPGVIYRGHFDGRWRMDFVSAGCEEFTGYPAEELLFDGVPALARIVHPDDKESLSEDCARAIAQQLPCRNEYRIITKMGEVRWVLEQAEGSYAPSGAIESVAGYVTDITTRKVSEIALRESERGLLRSQRAGKVGSWRWVFEPNSIVWSEELYRIHGLDPAVERGPVEAYFSLVHPEDQPPIHASLEALRAGHDTEAVEYRITRPDGALVHVRGTSAVELDASGAAVGAYGMIQDVTDARTATEALRESEANYRLLFEHAGEAVVVLDPKMRVRVVNQQALRLFGRSRDDTIGRHADEILVPEEAATTIALFRKVFESGQPVSTESPYQLAIGTRMMNWVARPVKVEGEVILALVIASDVTAERELESALEASGTRAERLLAASQDGFILADGTGIIVEVNAAYAAMVGYESSELVGTNVVAHEASLDEAAVGAHIAQMMRDGRAKFTTRHLHKDGREIALQVSATVLQQPEGPVVAAFVRDVTEDLVKQKVLTDSRRKLKALAGRIEAVREDERTAVAREIHDQLGQGLTGIKLELSWLVGQLAATNKTARARGVATMNDVDGLIDDVRALASRLRPAILDDLGLMPAVEWQLARLTERAGLRTQTDLIAPDGLSPEGATTLFRIFQESATNVVRHAQATIIEVVLREVGDAVELQISDDGVGLPDDSEQAGVHLGILGMRERAERAGGEFVIRARPSGGTVVIARVPRGGGRSE